MKTQNSIINASIIAIAIIILGFCIFRGLRSFADKERIVTVKGLSERIVDVDNANIVIKYSLGGNDLQEILRRIEINNSIVKTFAKKYNITESELTFSVPFITDKQNQQYGGYQIVRYRYYAKVKISIISKKVKDVKNFEMNQFDLLKEGVQLEQDEYQDEYNNTSKYSFSKLNDIKPDMIKESIANAQKAAEEFAKNSNSKIKTIKSARQGQFEINTTDDPLKVKIRVVSSIDYFIK